ncbi:hypothetical protein [Stenotrophomonas lactitubi]|uniref:hypothetical protein n=1 Tax=Stenotrophomonas lactitubi TaxID=2045214 RepID=UPI0028A0EF6E|nr:hypothetical protein [Stenotrophomonas lactitubi]
MNAAIADREFEEFELGAGTAGRWVFSRADLPSPTTKGGERGRVHFVSDTYGGTGVTAVPVEDQGRLSPNNASFVYGDCQYKSFISERQRLVQKDLLDGLSRRESLELKMIEWAIDRAELAAHKDNFDRLEQVAAMQEQLLANIDALNRMR